jgi:hypothetical protein
VPERCEATSRIYVDTQTVPKPLMAGLAFQPDIDQQVQCWPEAGLASQPEPFLERLVRMIGVTAENRDRAIDGLMERIKIDPTGGNLTSSASVTPMRARRPSSQGSSTCSWDAA